MLTLLFKPLAKENVFRTGGNDLGYSRACPAAEVCFLFPFYLWSNLYFSVFDRVIEFHRPCCRTGVLSPDPSDHRRLNALDP